LKDRRLKAGYLADLDLLSGDIEATEPDMLHEVRPAITICGGRITLTGHLHLRHPRPREALTCPIASQ
jgi:hypothetical protein